MKARSEGRRSGNGQYRKCKKAEPAGDHARKIMSPASLSKRKEKGEGRS